MRKRGRRRDNDKVSGDTDSEVANRNRTGKV